MYISCVSVFADLSRQAMRSVYVTRWKQLVANSRELRGGGGGEGATKSLRIKDSFGNNRKVIHSSNCHNGGHNMGNTVLDLFEN